MFGRDFSYSIEFSRCHATLISMPALSLYIYSSCFIGSNSVCALSTIRQQHTDACFQYTNFKLNAIHTQFQFEFPMEFKFAISHIACELFQLRFIVKGVHSINSISIMMNGAFFRLPYNHMYYYILYFFLSPRRSAVQCSRLKYERVREVNEKSVTYPV